LKVKLENNEHKKAYKLAVEAYLEGFELVEQNINALDKTLRLEIEAAMTGLRNKIRGGESIELIRDEIAAINNKLTIADELLDSTSLSGSTAFASAFFIVLREGLEALHIVAALAAFLVKTGRQDGLRYIHMGWVSVLALGLLIFVDVVRRVFMGSEPVSSFMMGVGVIALIANVYCLMLIQKHKDGEVHMRASWVFSKSDVIANTGVIVAGLLVWVTGSRWPDLIIGCLIALVIFNGARHIILDARSELAKDDTEDICANS